MRSFLPNTIVSGTRQLKPMDSLADLGIANQ
jgi:hypothetical protein